MLSILFLLLLVTSVIQSRAGQREIRNRVSAYLSAELNTRVSFGYIGWNPLQGITIKDAFIEDHRQDTLFYIGDIKAKLKLYDDTKHFIYVSKVSLDRVYVNLRQYHEDDDLNVVLFIDQLDSGPRDTTKAPVIWTLLFEEVKLRNTSFRLRFDDDTVSGRAFKENDIRFNEIQADLRNFYVVDDSLNFEGEHLSLVEQNSFRVKRMKGNGIICSHGMYYSDLLLETENSRLGDYFAMEYDSWRSFNEFYDQVILDAALKNSEVSFKDIRYFSDNLLDWDETVYVTGEGRGPLRSMRGKNLDLQFGQESELKGSLQMKGLPDIDKTYIDAKIDKAKATRSELASLIPMDIWPDELERLGVVTYTGRYTGFIYDFVAYGNFQTALGTLNSDLNMKLHEPEEYSGKIQAENFDLGKLLDIPATSKISFNGKVDGKGFDLKTMESRVEAKISYLDLNGYGYRNLDVNGLLKEQLFKGNLDVKDPNLEMSFNGTVGLSGKEPVFDCTSTFYKAELANLKWTPDFPALITGKLVMDFHGAELDNFLGTISLVDVELEKDKRVYPIDSMTLVSSLENGYRSITLTGDLMDARIDGHYSPSLLDKSFNNFLAQLLPNTTNLERVEMPEQELEFAVNFKKTREFTELVLPGTWVQQGYLQGEFNSSHQTLSLNVNFNQAHYSDFGFTDLRLYADSSVGDEKFSLTLTCSELTNKDSSWAHGILVDLGVMKSDVDFKIAGYSDPYSTEVDLNGKVNFSDTSIFTSFHPSFIRIDTLKWGIGENSRLGIKNDTALVLEHFHLGTLNQSITLNGVLDGSDQDHIDIAFDRFRLEVLNPFIYPDDEGSIQGEVKGDISIKSFKGSIPLFTSNLKIDSLGLNGDRLGNLTLNAKANKQYELINVNGLLQDGDFRRFGLSGFVKTAKENSSYNLSLDLDTTPLHIFEPFFVDLASEFKGKASGKIDISGPLNKPVLKGKFKLDSAAMKVDYLNTYYSFNTIVNISSSRIDLGRFKIQDNLYDSSSKQEHIGYCSGFISHKNFQDFALNVELSNLRNFLCLNTTIEDNEYYYGTAFMTGSARFTGTFDDLKIDVKGKAEKNSAFFVPLENYYGSSELEFIRFVNFDDYGSFEPYQDLDGIQMNFDLEITPSTEIQLIFDSRLGDIIRARGYSKLRMEINSNGDFKMYGDYIVEEGDYLFTAVNLINKKFVIEKGGRITWNGDPMAANMNLEAVYTAKATLENLVRGIVTEDQLSAYRQRTDVNAIMNLKGELTSPSISFGIAIPNISSLSSTGINTSTVNTVLNTIKQDQEEMTRQVFSLLVANTFIPPAVNQQFAAGDVQSGLLSSSVGDLLSNQVSNWLGQINSDWRLGVNYIAGNQSDFLINASRKFFDDRLEIQGTFGTNANFYNNVSAMYSITPDGRLRVRAFNRTGTLQTNDPTNTNTNAINRNINTQGVGLYYSVEFDRLNKDRRAIRKKLKEQKKAGQNP